jgi:hypothetical protein
VTFRCAVEVGGKAVARVVLTSPGRADEVAAFAVEGASIGFTVSVRAVAAAIITFA